MILYISKPKGFTSYDLIHKIKKLYPRKTKIGHAWTLDPMATGLMIVAIGKDTKRIRHYVWMDKVYQASIDFSKTSDTRDMDYRKDFKQLALESLTAPTLQEIEKTLEAKIWRSRRPLTPFSARKIRGKKLYEYAREGNPIFMETEMQLLWFTILSYDFPVLEVELHVWSWTYIRSIAHWLGSQFALGWILTALHRSKVGDISL